MRLRRSLASLVAVAVLATLSLALPGCDSTDDGTDVTVTDNGTDNAPDAGGDTPAADTDDHGQKFALTLTGTAFGPHEGQVVTVGLLEAADNTARATRTATVAGGTFTVSFADLLEAGIAYTVKYYADLNGNGQCDAPPADHAWSVDVPAVTGDVTIPVTHNTNFDTAACTVF